jgi:hypothetical protein
LLAFSLRHPHLQGSLLAAAAGHTGGGSHRPFGRHSVARTRPCSRFAEARRLPPTTVERSRAARQPLSSCCLCVIVYAFLLIADVLPLSSCRVRSFYPQCMPFPSSFYRRQSRCFRSCRDRWRWRCAECYFRIPPPLLFSPHPAVICAAVGWRARAPFLPRLSAPAHPARRRSGRGGSWWWRTWATAGWCCAGSAAAGTGAARASASSSRRTTSRRPAPRAARPRSRVGAAGSGGRGSVPSITCRPRGRQ